MIISLGLLGWTTDLKKTVGECGPRRNFVTTHTPHTHTSIF